MTPKATSAPPISVIIPVYGEETIIDETVRMVRETAFGAPVEIVVADGGPGHATLAALTEPDVTGVRCPPGRGVQMNAGGAAAHGEILVFLHADTRLPDGWPGRVAHALSGRAVAGAFSLGIDSPRRSLALVAAAANLRSRLERVPYGDQTLFFRADAFRALGGFAPVPIMEDVDIFRRLRTRGERIHILRERVLTSPRRWERDGVARRTLCNWLLRLRYAFGATPERLAESYRPHADAPSRDCLLFFVKHPEPGAVKTRLARAASMETAARFYAALAEDRLAALECGDFDVLVCFAPARRREEIAAWLGPGREYLAQRGADLGERMENGFRDAFARGYERAVLAGSDIPGLTPELVRRGLDALSTGRAALGPAEDGGYYLAGFHRDGFVGAALHDPEWSTHGVFARARGALAGAGLAVAELDRLRDADTPDDLRALLDAGVFGGPVKPLARALLEEGSATGPGEGGR
jgi:rSAM/selenodomain-associated transferase 2/rSAM/selenodomain-associated transferase 1